LEDTAFFGWPQHFFGRHPGGTIQLAETELTAGIQNQQSDYRLDRLLSKLPMGETRCVDPIFDTNRCGFAMVCGAVLRRTQSSLTISIVRTATPSEMVGKKLEVAGIARLSRYSKW
jgi:hypothetical protein